MLEVTVALDVVVCVWLEDGVPVRVWLGDGVPVRDELGV